MIENSMFRLDKREYLEENSRLERKIVVNGGKGDPY
jgi:hypothetical protein